MKFVKSAVFTIAILWVAVFAGLSGLTKADAAGLCMGCCGTLCMAQMNAGGSFCPTCNAWRMQNTMMTPWQTPVPYWWTGGAMNYSNFYAPAPWYYTPGYYAPSMGYQPGIMPGYYPGSGQYLAGKPNIYVEGPAGTEFTMKTRFIESESNWLAAVPIHGEQGWKGKLVSDHQIQTEQGTYPFLFSDYRVQGLAMQDKEGFCAPKERVLGKMAMALKESGFAKTEIGDFLEYWTVKLPASKSYCVYPQDERQLDQIAVLEVLPKPVSVRRVLFMVQVEEGLNKTGQKFTAAPVRSWRPEPARMLASSDGPKGLVVREWGVGFLVAREPR